MQAVFCFFLALFTKDFHIHENGVFSREPLSLAAMPTITEFKASLACLLSTALIKATTNDKLPPKEKQEARAHNRCIRCIPRQGARDSACVLYTSKRLAFAVAFAVSGRAVSRRAATCDAAVRVRAWRHDAWYDGR